MKTFFKIIFTSAIGLFASMIYAANLSSPVGTWQTIDDVTHKPKAIIEISEASNHTLSGRIVKVINPEPGHELCKACEGAKHNQPIVGMTILENLSQSKRDPMEWSGGQILDPKNGKLYRCKMTLIENGYRLNVKGYIGIPLLGRTQTWNRVQR